MAAAELLAELERGGATLPTRRDAQWRWPLPPVRSRQVEALPVAELRRIAEAAAGTLRTASEQGVAGRAVGQRALRDALLDHVAVLVTPDGPPAAPVEVPQRLVQAVVRMGFLGAAHGSVGRPRRARRSGAGGGSLGRPGGTIRSGLVAEGHGSCRDTPEHSSERMTPAHSSGQGRSLGGCFNPAVRVPSILGSNAP